MVLNNRLDDPLAEMTEATKDGLLGEIELLALGHHFQLLFGQVVVLLVRFIQLQTALKVVDKRARFLIP